MLTNSGIVQFLPLIIVFVIFYFLLIRPQQARQKELKLKLAGLRRGDRIVTSGGIIATVILAKENDPEIDIEIAPETRVKLLRAKVATVLSSSAKPANDVKKPKQK
ncbi:preprotein translocase subunit YajC [Candidatus Kirkpatrickella diaphorinae]|uniref:Sec translocon accessory complex subunit YajC n=1 Tax=Candidatus Kirkpatrickella diaphorinae TaxID=2984322 RepID=A0ABY6GG75_9PROT|nr:preprotein translocase subunit YajC [Candidatus Kirkpatrickella diaphorinae]UYH50493.1 preprotein translocase subunit YajC [Candidatus Kirkpatrickella diaphorinae]